MKDEYKNTTPTNMKVGDIYNISEIEKAIIKGLIKGNLNIKKYNPTHQFSSNAQFELYDAILNELKKVL